MKKHFILKLLFISLLMAQTLWAEPIARIMKSNGNVFLKTLGSPNFSQPARPGLAINNGDAIKVGEVGFAVVIYIDDRSIIKVRENTQFQFVDSPSTRTINIDKGTILNNVKKEGRTKTFRVETPVSVASVKGTEFAVITDPAGVDQFFGAEGQFDVFNMISGQTVTVGPGQKAVSNAMGNLMQMPYDPSEYPEDPAPEVTEPTEEEPTEEEAPEEAPEEVPEEAPAPEEAPTVTPEAPAPPPEAPTPEEQPEAPTPEAGAPFGMGLGVGSVTIDGKLYNQLALRPELTFGKLGIGLDIVLYIDNEGNFRKDEWDELSDIADKFLYIRWGQKSDPFWFKLGALPSVTMGYGGLMMGYSNMMEFPTVRPIGLNAGVHFGKLGTELFFANLKDFARGGTLFGVRPTYRISKAFPLTIGANFIIDVNQFGGLKDNDGDNFPNIFDDFPDDKHLWNDTDGDGIPDYNGGDKEPSSGWDIDGDGDNQLSVFAGGTDVETLKAEPFSTKDNKARAIGFAVDVGYPVFSNKIVNLLLYSEFNMLSFPGSGKINTAFYRPDRSGTGITIPGIRAQIFKIVNLNFEYRIKRDYFVPQFFDQSYDVSRVVPVYTETETIILTKDRLLFDQDNSNVAQNGYFGSAGVDLLGLAQLQASYANMVADTIKFRSFTASVSLNADKIPKLSEASAYYQRNNDANPFDFGNPSVNTILGYRMGYEVSQGVSLIWDFRQFYRDDGTGKLVPVKQTNIETAFNF